MTLAEFIVQLETQPETIAFSDTMAVIEENFVYTPTAFKNGDTENAAGTNEGSCKLFAFAKRQAFDKMATLMCFGDYYRKDVLENPEGTDHANIRNFIVHGWSGIHFGGEALSAK